MFFQRSRGHTEQVSAVDELLARARMDLDRVPAENLVVEAAAGALIVDIRPVEQRQRDGILPGALIIDRNVLQWRILDRTRPSV